MAQINIKQSNGGINVYVPKERDCIALEQAGETIYLYPENVTVLVEAITELSKELH